MSEVQDASHAPAAVQIFPPEHCVLFAQGTQAWVLVSQCGRESLVQSALDAQPSMGAQQPLAQVLPAPHWLEVVQLRIPLGHWPAPRHWPARQVCPFAQSLLVAQTLGEDPLEQALRTAAAKSEARSARETDDSMKSSKT